MWRIREWSCRWLQNWSLGNLNQNLQTSCRNISSNSSVPAFRSWELSLTAVPGNAAFLGHSCFLFYRRKGQFIRCPPNIWLWIRCFQTRVTSQELVTNIPAVWCFCLSWFGVFFLLGHHNFFLSPHLTVYFFVLLIFIYIYQKATFWENVHFSLVMR